MNNDTLVDAIGSGVDFALANLHTATIAKVTKITGSTISAKPVFNRSVDGESIPLPEFAEIPVLWISGGGSSDRMPIAVGDYALLIFIERCIDDWFFGKDYDVPREMRLHDYSDAIAIVGLFNNSGALPIPSVRTMDGDIIINGDVTHNGNIIVNGNITATGTITATVDVIGGGISLKNHTHSGVQTGSGTTGAAQ